MANFLPLKNYFLYSLDKLISKYHLQPPFLDIGCGIGDVSSFIATKGWSGKAIDISEKAVDAAKTRLSDYPVKVEKMSFFSEKDKFNTIIAFDVIEHIENDGEAIIKISDLLEPNGYFVMIVPSNPNEWRWDDEYYGHYRRYRADEIKDKLIAANLDPVEMWDVTYPLFWLMRRLYILVKKKPTGSYSDKESRTKGSSLTNSWDMGFLSKLLAKDWSLWKSVYSMQHLFRNQVTNGHEVMVIARKKI